MPGIITYLNDIHYDTLTEDTTATAADLEANPLTEHLAKPFVSFLDQLASVRASETASALQALRPSSRLDVCAEHLVNELVDVAHVVRAQKNATVSDHFNGSSRPSTLRKRPGNERLSTAQNWLRALKVSPIPALASRAPALEARITTFEQTAASAATAEEAHKKFKDFGPRMLLIEQANALRKATYGALGEIAHSHLDQNLSTDFADNFFRHGHRRDQSITTLQSRIEATEKTLADLRERLASAVAAEKAAEEKVAAEQRQALEQELADAKNQAAEANKVVEALQAKLAPSDGETKETKPTEGETKKGPDPSTPTA